jgi:hypothetical protein
MFARNKRDENEMDHLKLRNNLNNSQIYDGPDHDRSLMESKNGEYVNEKSSIYFEFHF